MLGLGDIGPRAALPVMEGKSALFKAFGGLDSIPIVLDTTDVDEIVETLVRLRPSFGAVNLEDVAAPRCFELERRLIEALDCPVMHDDQHGTAIVLLAALRGACAVQGRPVEGLRVVVSGAGAAGVACARILLGAGVRDVVVLDSRGVLDAGRGGEKAALAAVTNPRGVTGGIADALAGADVFVGLSGGTLPEELLALMAPESIVFALSNPDPEVHPDVARRHAAIVATGPQRLPQPDQQRARLPRRLPRRARRGRPAHHRAHEDRRGRRDLRGGAGRPRPGPDRAQPVRPAGRARGRRGGGGARMRRGWVGRRADRVAAGVVEGVTPAAPRQESRP